MLSVAGLKRVRAGYMTADEFMDIVHKQGLTGFGTSYDNLGRTYDTIARKSAQAAKRSNMSTAGKIKYVKTDADASLLLSSPRLLVIPWSLMQRLLCSWMI